MSTSDSEDVVLGEIQKNIAFANELLSTFSQGFANDVGKIKVCANQAAAAIRKLKSALIRQRAENVSDLIKKGELAQAAENLAQNYDCLQEVHLEEIFKLCTCNGGSLKNAINFIDHVDPDLKVATCVIVYQEMVAMNCTGDVEIVLLRSKINALTTQNVQVIVTKQKIEGHVQKLINRIVREIKINETVLSEKAIACSLETFQSIILMAVSELFRTNSPVTILLRYAMKLSSLASCCRVLDETLCEVKIRNWIRLGPGLFLRAFIKHLQKFKSIEISHLDPVSTSLFEKAIAETRVPKHVTADFVLLKKRLEQNTLKELLENDTYVLALMDDFVNWYYDLNKTNLPMLISASAKIGFYEGAGCLQKSIFITLETKNQLQSFDAFKLFHAVHKVSTYNASDKCTEDIEFVRSKIPTCLGELLRNCYLKKQCRVVNKYYDEPLYFSETDGVVYSWVPGTRRGNQLWDISISNETSLVTFGCAHSMENAPTSPKTVFYQQWMIKAVDGDYVKIFNNKNEYLTSDPRTCVTDSNNRTIQLRPENTSDTEDMQLWQFEFEP